MELQHIFAFDYICTPFCIQQEITSSKLITETLEQGAKDGHQHHCPQSHT